jgi:hypothetical protein
MKKSLIALAAMAASGCSMASGRRSYDDQGRGHELRAMNMGGLEASLKAQLAAARTAPAPVDGRAVFITDKAVLGAAAGGGVGTPALTDTIDFFIPAGTKVCDLAFVVDDADTGTTFQVSIGYRAVSTSDGSLATNTTYFAAAAAFAQAAGRVECTFKPILFQQDVWLMLTVTAAPTGISGNPEIHMIAGCQSEGSK